MKSTIMKKGRTAVALAVSLAMIFATVSYPVSVAKADTTSSLILSGITKDEALVDTDPDTDGIQLIIPEGNNFIFIKQANVRDGLSVLWTKDELTDQEKQEILDYVIAQNGASEDDATLANINFFFGFGTFTITPDKSPAYDYIFGAGDEGTTILTFDSGKISHIWYGKYERETTEYDISVTKAVTLNGEEDPEGLDGSVYVSLFEDADLENLIETKEIAITNGVGGTATFTVEETGTYYVAETDSAGNVIEPGIDFLGHFLLSIDNDQEDGVTVTTESSEGVTITNNLVDREPDSVPLEFTKVLTGMELEEEMFKFGLFEGEWDATDEEVDLVQLLQTTWNDEDGNVVFEDLEFEEAGTYYFLVKELPDTDDPIEGLTYDTHVVIVKVEVTFDEDTGKYIATPSFEGSTTFTNTYEEEQFGEISVTKEVTVLSDDENIKVNYTFYAALFNEDKELVSEVMALEVNDSEEVTVTFENLDLDETYYVYETDEDGNIIETDADGVIATPIVPEWVKIGYDNNVVTLDVENRTGEVTINNVFDPEEQYLYGAITVKKTVTLNGEPLKTKRVFYVALFADEALTELVSEVKALNMNGNATTTVEFVTDKNGEQLLAGTVYYIAETDKNGVAISDPMAQLGCEIEIDKPSVEITEDTALVNLVNKFKKEEFPVTGDTSNMNLWLFLAVLGVAGAIAPFALRKREEIND